MTRIVFQGLSPSQLDLLQQFAKENTDSGQARITENSFDGTMCMELVYEFGPSLILAFSEIIAAIITVHNKGEAIKATATVQHLGEPPRECSLEEILAEVKTWN